MIDTTGLRIIVSLLGAPVGLLFAQTLECTGPKCIICKPGKCSPSISQAIPKYDNFCQGTGNAECNAPITKTLTYTISFPDGYSEVKEQSAKGQAATAKECHAGVLSGPYKYGECWPYFYTATGSDGHFSQRAEDAYANITWLLCGVDPFPQVTYNAGFQCQPTGMDHWVVVDHKCCDGKC